MPGPEPENEIILQLGPESCILPKKDQMIVLYLTNLGIPLNINELIVL